MFHPLTEKDLPAIWERQQKLHALSSEYDAFRLYVWLSLDRTEIALWKNQFVLRFHTQDRPCYVAPYEIEAFPELLSTLEALERSLGGKTLFFLNAERPLSAFPDGYAATPRRDLYEYLYRAEDLITFHGHAYQAKRNQVSQFKRKYDWRFEPLSASNQDACQVILDAWDAQHEGDMVPHERMAIDRMLSLKGSYGQSGGLLFADGAPVAFAIGTHPRAEMMDVVAEKALPGYTGAYATIIQSYAAYAYSLSPFTYINREEDMDLENLRNAKMQLKPTCLIEKTLMTKPL